MLIVNGVIIHYYRLKEEKAINSTEESQKQAVIVELKFKRWIGVW